MIKKTLIFLPLALLFLSLMKSPAPVKPWNEEKTDSLGTVVTAHSLGEAHSSVHYDLTKVLAMKMGLSPDTAEIIARFCALVDQINAKAGYPYGFSLNGTSIPDTFPTWPQSLAGTERGAMFSNSQNEFTAQYWHFPFRDPADTLTGGMVWKAYPEVTSFTHFTGPPHFWRVPITYNLKSIMQWALYNGGEPGLPDQLTPVEVKYADATSSGYQLVQPNSIQAFAIFLHSLADSYSHEECMAKDTIRAHPEDDPYCGLTYHSEHEFAYNTVMRAQKHADSCLQAIWRSLREFKRVHNISSPVAWTTDNNGFQDGDGIPDQLEDDGDGDYTESFLELWKNPATTDLTGDGVINHSDHTTWRIKLCNAVMLTAQVAINTDGSDADPSALLDVKSTNQGLLIPRIPTTTRDILPSPATGILIYNTTTNLFNYYNGTYWYQLEATLLSSTTGTIQPGGGVSINTQANFQPDNSAMLDVNDPTRGILIPRTTPNSITAPATGLIIFSTATNHFTYFNGIQWVTLTGVSTGIAGAGGSQAATGVSIKTNGSNQDPSAILDMDASDKGVLIPRLTTMQRDSILPSTGLVIYNSTGNSIEFYDGSSWYQLISNSFSCGSSFSINHVAGGVAPVSKTVTYGTVANIIGEPSKCWITSNLGADRQPLSKFDATEASAGWYWQFNRKQGYKYGTNRIPASIWISNIVESSDWVAANDPCAIELAGGWRLPAYSEWFNVDASGSWSDWNGPWGSGLKLHAAGFLNDADGSLTERGISGVYWSSAKDTAGLGWDLYFTNTYCDMNNENKAFGFTLRCIKE